MGALLRSTYYKNKRIIQFCNKVDYRRRIIFSDTGNLDSPDDVEDREQETFATEKPYGLWYSLGSSWIKYLALESKARGEADKFMWSDTRLSHITHIYDMEINDSILKIHGRKQFLDFQKKYGVKSKDAILWRRVASKWDGIEIRSNACPDISEYDWFDWFGLSSGVIWNKKGVKKFTLLKQWTPHWSETK